MLETVISKKENSSLSCSTTLNVVGLFSGIGGFELGFERSGHKTLLMCEIDSAAQAVLSFQFPDREIFKDIRELKFLPNEASLICAGFPCQNLSSVGAKAGISGSDSSLVNEVFRILQNHRVEWLILENVTFMLHLKEGSAISKIVSSLEELGYNWAYRIVDSAAFGIPHRRRRVYLVASLRHDPRTVLLSDDCVSLKLQEPSLKVPLGFYWTEGTRALGLAVDSIPPLKGGSTIGIPSPPAILCPNGKVVTPNIQDAERLQGFAANWTQPAESVAKASSRWKLVGNAVTVNVAEWLGYKLNNPTPYDSSKDYPLNAKKGWPDAAWSLGNGRFQSNVSQWPVMITPIGIEKFLEFEPKPLSAKATAGFLNRAEASSLKFPPGFLKALKLHQVRMQHFHKI
ncbi:DNA cytosine methyltransferase [Nostoc sp. CMAA1605]|uniref:DNA cytosine methyltransferase n=1 Tax=Nostoc sp. CMAA1605 TaxID=2055159 RepID=UPI001F452CCA|nr:DNA (cytosine-5-)-methyltransferase [Nostoc sp. CMAA1605]MCF4967374.1 DNA (cytosine-5-)-methyltransferase [Nostoc sp. CMAA1605]